MKNLLVVLLVMMFTTSVVYSQDLVGQWTFEEGVGDTTADVTGQGSTGIIQGGVTWSTDTPNGEGFSLEFDGTTGNVDLGDPDMLYVEGPITLSAWVKPRYNSAQRFNNIICKGHTSSPKGEVNLRIHRASDGDSTSSFYRTGSWDDNGNHEINDPMPVTDWGQWVHLAGTYDGLVWSIYRNGELDTLFASDVGAVYVVDSWAIGSKGNLAGAYDRYFKGNIDNVRMYNDAITAEEVKALYEGDLQSGTKVKAINEDINYRLEQNYPNPFNPTTTIRYNLQKSETVSLNIYNTNGQLIETLLNNARASSGNHAIQVNMSQYPSGIYVYVIDIGNQKLSGKMTYMK